MESRIWGDGVGLDEELDGEQDGVCCVASDWRAGCGSWGGWVWEEAADF